MKNLLVFVCLVLLLALAVVPAFAQDGAPVVTAEPAPVADPVVDQPAEVVTLPSWLLVNAAAVFMALGALSVLLTNWQRSGDLKTALNMADKRSQDAIEAAYEALPEGVQDVIHRALDLAEYLRDQAGAVLEFADEVTDGKPNDPPDETQRE